MKQIFDWLREQIRERIKLYQTLDVTETAVDVAIKETEKFIEYINEAEAKWVASASGVKGCCEWKIDAEAQWYTSYKTSCGNSIITGKRRDNYCSKCGKPIKISEVE